MKIFSLTILFFLSFSNLYSITYQSISGKGSWQSNSSWIGGVVPPDANNVIARINGSITSTTSLSFNNNITIQVLTNDTLIILGDLILNNNSIIEVQPGGVLLVRGNFTCNNNMNLDANSYLIVTGSLNIKNNNDLNSATSPSKVFIGNGYTSGNGTGGNVLTCPTGGTNYHTDCNYGDFVDIMNDPIASWLLEITCSPKPFWYSSPDVNPNPAVVGGTLNFTANAGNNWPVTITNYAWSGPQSFMYVGASGNTSRNSITNSMSGYYKVNVLNSVGCILKDSIYVLVNNSSDCGATFNQGYFSRNNYSGAWESSSSWEATDPSFSIPPSTSNAGQNVLINGYITINGDYSPTGSNQLICDTLIVTGNLNLVNPTLTVSSTGVLIVLGNIAVAGSSGGTINNLGGRIVVNGNTELPYNYTYSQTGTGTSGAIYPLGGLNSPQASVTVNDHDLSYMQANDPDLFTFYSNVVCGGGISGGTITVNDASICAGDNVVFTSTLPLVPEAGTSYQWYSSPSGVAGSWSLISGQTGISYTVGSLSATTWYYRQAQKGAGCTANSNTIQVVVYARPVTSMINHD